MNHRAIVRALRPNQWTKNGVVLVPFFFALADRQQHIGGALLFKAAAATLLFCVLSGAVYLLNDLHDRERDREHPAKKHRPIAAGTLPVGVAWAWALGLLAAGLAGAWFVSGGFLAAATAYVAMQGAYTFFLKQVALVDVFVIAAGFVLRAIAGALAITVYISPWLLLCTFLLALFLALCKRRREKIACEGLATRASLDGYSERLLDLLISITATATIVSYALYTLWPDTVAKFGTHALAFTVPYVLYGVFRYLDLVYRHEGGERPEKILLTDLPLIVDIVLYAITAALILFGPR